MVGIASHYTTETLHLSDAKATLLPSLVYIWFLVCTIPTDILMEKIGRKHTVLICMCVLILSLLIPLFFDSYGYMVACFILVGISNVCLQSSLYPLFSTMVEREKLTYHFTLGESVKTASSFVAPYIATFGALYCAHLFNLGWRFLFLVYLILSIVSLLLLLFMEVDLIKGINRGFTPSPFFIRESFALGVETSL